MVFEPEGSHPKGRLLGWARGTCRDEIDPPGLIPRHERNRAGSTGLSMRTQSSAVTAAAREVRLGNNKPSAQSAVRQRSTGHDQCESNVATPLKASHPMQGSISD